MTAILHLLELAADQATIRKILFSQVVPLFHWQDALLFLVDSDGFATAHVQQTKRVKFEVQQFPPLEACVAENKVIKRYKDWGMSTTEYNETLHIKFKSILLVPPLHNL